MAIEPTAFTRSVARSGCSGMSEPAWWFTKCRSSAPIAPPIATANRCGGSQPALDPSDGTPSGNMEMDQNRTRLPAYRRLSVSVQGGFCIPDAYSVAMQSLNMTSNWAVRAVGAMCLVLLMALSASARTSQQPRRFPAGVHATAPAAVPAVRQADNLAVITIRARSTR